MQQEFDSESCLPQSCQLCAKGGETGPSYPGADFFPTTSHPSPPSGSASRALEQLKSQEGEGWFGPLLRLDDQLPRCSLQPAGRSQSTNWKMISSTDPRARHFSVRKRTMSLQQTTGLQSGRCHLTLISPPELSQPPLSRALNPKPS